MTAGLLPVREWFGVTAAACCESGTGALALIQRYHCKWNFTFLSASFKGSICDTPDGDVIVGATDTLVADLVLYGEQMNASNELVWGELKWSNSIC